MFSVLLRLLKVVVFGNVGFEEKTCLEFSCKQENQDGKVRRCSHGC